MVRERDRLRDYKALGVIRCVYPDFVECSPDREAFKQEWEDRPVVEIKDTKRIIDDMEVDSIPKEWYAQVQFQMAVMGRKNAFLVICDGRKELKYGHYTFDKDWTLTNMRKATDWFHKHIIGGEQPEPTTAHRKGRERYVFEVRASGETE